MITNDAERLVTEAHFAQFERAPANLTAAAGEQPTKLQRLEIDAVRAKISDFRDELRECIS
jgi:hypothetical protein